MIEITEVITNTAQGLTEPALCRGTDGHLYIVKKTANLELKNEYICAHLGQKFGLLIPKFSLAFFPYELLNFDSKLKEKFGDTPCFASRYCQHVQEFDRTSYSQTSAQFFKDLFIFDYWIKNDDRNFVTENGGNPNLIVDKRHENIYVIDHNMAFDNNFDLESFKKSHVGCNYWFNSQLDMLDIEYYKEKISDTLQGLELFVDKIPEEWCEDLPKSDYLQTITAKLSQYKTESFWRAIQ